MVHDAAATGYQAQSDVYAMARPSYHSEIIDVLVAHVGAGPVVDLGAGTGISTTALVGRGVETIAVEPVAAMREKLAAIAQATVLEGTAESIPVNGGSASAVVVAQAFHWFNHDPALDEIARVLRSGGVLATLWNVRDETVPWMAAYTAIQDRVQGDTPRYRTMAWRRAIENDPRFELAHEESRPNPQPSDADHTLARFLSTSFIASLDAATRDALSQEIRLLVADLGDSYDFPYTTEVQIWRHRG